MNDAERQKMLDALNAQHKAIDTLLAMLIQRDSTFFPTKSEVWPLIVKGRLAIVQLESQS